MAARTRWPALSCDTQAYSRRAPYRPAAPRTTHTRWPELDHAPTFAPAVQIDVIIDIEFRLSILYNAMLSHNEYVGARTAMPLHSCRMPEKLRDPVSSGTLSSSSPSATGSHACPESLCMLRSLPWFRNMPSVLQPSVPEAMRVAPQISERARGMQHAHHNAPCVRMLRVTYVYVCAVEPMRARAVCISQVWAETHVIQPVPLNCLDQAAKTSLGHCVPPASNTDDLRPRSLPWVMHCDLRVCLSTRSEMI